MPLPERVEDSLDFPEKVDVAIIGGGIAGVATALELAEAGYLVAVFEKGHIACEQSSRNWGWCRQMGRDPREIPLSKISLDLWRSMRQRLNADVGFRECGITYLCANQAALDYRLSWFEKHAGSNGLSTRVLSADEALSFAPGSTRSWMGGLHTPDDGRAEPTIAVPAMARAVQAKGGLVFQNTAVRSIERMGGQARGIVTEKGVVDCDAVVLAGGAWSRRFCENMGISFPQLAVTNSVCRTAPFDAGIENNVAGGNFAVRKRLDGGYTIAHSRYSVADIVPDSFRLFREFLPSLKTEWRDLRFRMGRRFFDEFSFTRTWAAADESPFEHHRINDPKPVESILKEALDELSRVLPQFQDIEIVEKWAGLIDVTPDAVPVISAVDEVPGFFIASGFSGHGFGLGPGAGKLMAEIVRGVPTCVDPTAFHYSRFKS